MLTSFTVPMLLVPAHVHQQCTAAPSRPSKALHNILAITATNDHSSGKNGCFLH
jgi:hypothetical protein